VTGRDRIVITVIAVAAALAAFWFLALSPKRKDATSLGAQLTEQQRALDTAQSDVQASRAAQGTYGVNYATVARLGKAVPVDDDVPSLVYQLDSTAKATGVNFRSIKLAQSSTSQPTTPTPPAAGGAKGSEAPASTPAPSAAPVSTPATAAGAATLPPGAVVGSAGFATMPFTFEFDGSFFKLSDFFSRVEDYITASSKRVDVTGRLLSIDGFSMKASTTGFPNMTANVAATAYLLPAGQGLTDGASPQGPAAPGASTPVGTTGGAPPTAPATVTGP